MLTFDVQFKDVVIPYGSTLTATLQTDGKLTDVLNPDNQVNYSILKIMPHEEHGGVGNGDIILSTTAGVEKTGVYDLYIDGTTYAGNYTGTLTISVDVVTPVWFTIEGKRFEAAEGMTWEEWTTSEYAGEYRYDGDMTHDFYFADLSNGMVGRWDSTNQQYTAVEWECHDYQIDEEHPYVPILISYTDTIKTGENYWNTYPTSGMNPLVPELAITFTIDDVQYKAAPGMTWEQWVSSLLNTDEARIVNGYVVFEDPALHVANSAGLSIAWPENQIQANGKYVLSTIS